MDELAEKLADKLFVNFSLFQSVPDVWGIEQIFPVLPLSGLDQPPLVAQSFRILPAIQMAALIATWMARAWKAHYRCPSGQATTSVG